ncbi:UNVERIFIED_CONTAM: hypothetical protein FKN15_030143 [Acipenser sinensis]
MTHLQAGLSPETLEKSKVELKENPDTLHQDIQEVRDMIITRPDIGFLRTDDAFILRFLRARKFNHFEAFRLLAQYFEYRQQNLDMFKNFKATDLGIKQALKDGFPGVLSNLDHYGRKILVLFAANWDQSRYTFVDILRAILLSLEAMIEDPELQVNGFVLIIDWSNFTFKQASKLTPSMLRLAIEGLQKTIKNTLNLWPLKSILLSLRPCIDDENGPVPSHDLSGRAEALLLYTFVDILRAILLSLEAMIEDPELQVNGFVLIIDWSNFTFKQASKLTPSMLRLAIEGLQIFMHGNNLNSLHQLIHPEILPSEFGGMLPPYDMGTWARTLLDHEYDDDSEQNPESYNLAVEELEQDLSPKTMKRSQSVVEPGVLKRPDKEKHEEENMQPLLSLD